jgi:hypothetical protein
MKNPSSTSTESEDFAGVKLVLATPPFRWDQGTQICRQPYLTSRSSILPNVESSAISS